MRLLKQAVSCAIVAMLLPWAGAAQTSERSKPHLMGGSNSRNFSGASITRSRMEIEFKEYCQAG